MTQNTQQDQFYLELNNLIDRFRSEYDLTVASAVGVLEVVKMELFMGEMEQNEEEE